MALKTWARGYLLLSLTLLYYVLSASQAPPRIGGPPTPPRSIGFQPPPSISYPTPPRPPSSSYPTPPNSGFQPPPRPPSSRYPTPPSTIGFQPPPSSCYPTPPGNGGIIPNTTRCSKDPLKLDVCANVLGGTVVAAQPQSHPCCSLLAGLVDLEVGVCLCLAIKANVLGINLNVPLSLNLILNFCQRSPPIGLTC